MKRPFSLVAVLLSALVLPASAGAATPTAALSAYGARPGATVTVTGTGFDASAAVDVFIDTSNIAIATSSSSGAVSITVTIPYSTQPGYHYLTLDEERTHAAAQAQINVYAAWQQGAYGASWLGFNPYENTLSPSNVGQLGVAWSTQVTGYGNPKPFVISGNNIYLYDENGAIHVYTTAGKLLWTASPPGSFAYSQAYPSAPGSLVYFGNTAGQVFAYNYMCRTDGGSCTPQWTANIGTQVIGGITARGGLLYIPGADGFIHVLNGTTGAIGTSLTPFTSGALTSAVALDTAGDAWVAQGNVIEFLRSGGGGGYASFASGTTVSRPAVSNDAAYYTTSTGYLYTYGADWSDVSLGGTTGCGETAPVVAGNVVYAAGCSTLGAWDAGTGAPLWSVAIPYPSEGLSVANGVLYACIADRLEAYDASYGGTLWNGGDCSAAPEIVNGAVYAAADRLEASTLSGGYTASMRSVRPTRPDPLTLHTNPRLKQKWLRRHHEHARHRDAGQARSRA